MKREELIEYIKQNDRTYNYNAVNFKYYSDKDLAILKKRIDREKEDEEKKKGKFEK
ncbi:MAG TPA: hypothetical protein VNZ49_07300 [Bacteroidia bacterium]|jgi:hypothetical protein|nr:hypothetical protein [Bacteroidia bacterium]